MNSSHHFEAHKSYIRGIDESICRYMSELRATELCEFVKITESCHEADYKVDYLSLSFCEITKHFDMSRPTAALFLFVLTISLAFLLSILVYTTTPNIIAIVKFLRLSEHNASTTAIVLINGLPDVVSAFVFFEGDTEMVVNEMLGTGVYLWAFHGGIVMMCYPHSVYSIYFIRDVIAASVGLVFQYIINSEADTSVFEGICALLLYPAYCFIVYVQHLGALEETAALRKIRTAVMYPKQSNPLHL